MNDQNWHKVDVNLIPPILNAYNLQSLADLHVMCVHK